MTAPASVDELVARAHALRGRSIDDVARELAMSIAADAVRTKGKVGELAERALGATGGSRAMHDFPELGVELKTIPVDARGEPLESTYVCTVVLGDAERAEWETSWVKAKLSHVLWLPVIAADDANAKTFGAAILWRPSEEEEYVLRDDFEDAMGTIAIGGIEGLSARSGRALQVRPKAKDGSVRAWAPGIEGDIATVPRGFYLRTSFTRTILRRGT
jgi:DNA mismatch repair protein MutH